MKLKEIQTQLESGALTSESLVKTYLETIENREPVIGAFLSVRREKALEEARAVDIARQSGEKLGPLAGIPIAIKDNINIDGEKTTCASKILEEFVAPFDATVIQKLKKERAIFIGKTNMDEFAMGSSTEHSALGHTTNPHDPTKVPGGSSGGSTAAVGAKEAPLALGSSTGGSIRQPAAFCGVVGVKPTYGRVSRYGLVAFGSSLDQIGPVAEDVYGAASLLQAISGQDTMDSTSAPETVPSFLQDLEKPLRGLRVGVVKEFASGGLQSEIGDAQEERLTFLKSEGASIIEVSLSMTDFAIPTYYLIATAEASSNLARFDGVRYSRRSPHARNLSEMYVKSRSEGFGPEVKRRILLGTYCLSSGYYEGFYKRAQQVRTQIANDYQNAFEKCDVILGPTTPTTAFPIGEKTNDPVAMYLNDIYTVPANLAGIPAISFPVGKDQAGLPIGLQVMAPAFEEARMLGVANQLMR